MYNLIVAICKNNGIGKSGKLPWKIKEDLSMFSTLTKGNGNNAIIMGRKTWESINKKPLPNRTNIILSTTLTNHLGYDNVHIFDSFDSINSHCIKSKYDNIWVIGGSTVYDYFLNNSLIKKCFVTFIDHEFDCDTFFPEIITNFNLETTMNIETETDYNVTLNIYTS
tara:strand:+ start:1059 stop:1559 length:501 start_codon:yes stop_codon:yes gene_type:complete